MSAYGIYDCKGKAIAQRIGAIQQELVKLVALHSSGWATKDKRMRIPSLGLLAALVMCSGCVTRLSDLCMTGTAPQIEQAVNAGADVNAKDAAGVSPLMRAVSRKNLTPDVIATLVKAGADVNAKDAMGVSPLMQAIVSNSNPDVIATLVKAGADVNVKDTEGMSPLMWAILKNLTPDVIATLVKAGADVNAESGKGATPLMFAASDSASPKSRIDSVVTQQDGRSHMLTIEYTYPAPKVIEILVHAGANVNAARANGVTPLQCAAHDNGNPIVVDALVKAGADVNAKDEDGNTPLFFAARSYISRGQSNSRAVECLVKAGADVNARNQKGETPLMWAVMMGKTYFDVKPNPETIWVLIKAGANINAEDKEGKSVLRFSDDRTVSDILTKRGAK